LLVDPLDALSGIVIRLIIGENRSTNLGFSVPNESNMTALIHAFCTTKLVSAVLAYG